MGALQGDASQGDRKERSVISSKPLRIAKDRGEKVCRKLLKRCEVLKERRSH